LPNQWTMKMAQIGPTDEQLEKLCEAAEQGYSLSACAATADVSKNTLMHWTYKGRPALEKLLRGEELSSTELVYASFAEQFEKARARGVKHLEDVSTQRAKDGMGTWSEAITKLERGHRDEFGRQPEVVQGGQPIVIHIEGRPSRELPPESFIDGEAKLVESDDHPGALPAASATASVS
jgi:hypothetical protein